MIPTYQQNISKISNVLSVTLHDFDHRLVFGIGNRLYQFRPIINFGSTFAGLLPFASCPRILGIEMGNGDDLLVRCEDSYFIYSIGYQTWKSKHGPLSRDGCPSDKSSLILSNGTLSPVIWRTGFDFEAALNVSRIAYAKCTGIAGDLHFTFSDPKGNVYSLALRESSSQRFLYTGTYSRAVFLWRLDGVSQMLGLF